VKVPPAKEGEFVALAKATLTRRAGATTSAVSSLDVGPALPGLAWARRGDWLWLASSEGHLAGVPAPATDPDLVRWSRLDLDAIRAEKGPWNDAEGASFEGRVRPFSDRILGLLGWAPKTTSVTVERRQEGNRFRERVVFASR
jgi:hypothetical protein